jgi:L-asparagine oxygenase
MTVAVPAQLKMAAPPPSWRVPYRIPVAHTFTAGQRAELEEILDVRHSPYADYAGYRDEITRLVARGAPPAYLLEVCEQFATTDHRDHPVLLLENCPTGEVPELDIDEPRLSKHERKKSFIAEAFLSVYAELVGTTIITYKNSNEGDMFHDIHPMRRMQFENSQKTVNSMSFHIDLPDSRVRPDWVNLLSLRNSRKNAVYTSFVRLRDVIAGLDPAVIAVLKRPLFTQPRTTVANHIPVYGMSESGLRDCRPILVVDRGYETFAYDEDFTIAESQEGKDALAALKARFQRIRHSLFLAERDFVSICNYTAMHARHVVEIRDFAAHQRRWILKTWNVDQVDLHRGHFVAGRINTVDE